MIGSALPVRHVTLVDVVAGVTNNGKNRNDDTNGDISALSLVIVPFIFLKTHVKTCKPKIHI